MYIRLLKIIIFFKLMNFIFVICFYCYRYFKSMVLVVWVILDNLLGR